MTVAIVPRLLPSLAAALALAIVAAVLPLSSRDWTAAVAAGIATSMLVLPAAAIAIVAGTAIAIAQFALGEALQRAIAAAVSVALAVPALVTVSAVSLFAPASRAAGDVFAHGVSIADLADSPLAIACSIAGALAATPLVAQLTRQLLARCSEEPWFRLARTQGIGRYRLVRAFVLPVIAIALPAMLARVIGILLAVSCVAETVIGWPGLGRLLVQSIGAHRVSASAACLMLMMGTMAVIHGIAAMAGARDRRESHALA